MQGERPDEQARRAYWTEQMDAACEFMNAISDYPVEECGERLVPIRELIQAAEVKVAFSHTKVGNGRDRLFYLREGLIADFIAVARDMNDRGWLLNIQDGYRTRAIQTELAEEKRVFDVILQRVVWELGGELPSTEVMFRRLSALVATRPKVGTHMSGSALDVSVLSLDDGSEIDRGGPYLELSELTPMSSPFISQDAQHNRKAITGLMARHGFVAYPFEFWHYCKGDAYDAYLSRSGKPGRYGAVDMDPDDGRATAIGDPLTSLHTPEAIRREIERALGRLRKRDGSSEQGDSAR